MKKLYNKKIYVNDKITIWFYYNYCETWPRFVQLNLGTIVFFLDHITIFSRRDVI